MGSGNIVVSKMIDGKAEIIENSDGKRTTPAATLIKPDAIVHGDVAKTSILSHPQSVVMNIKRFIGKKLNDPDILMDIQLSSLELVSDENDNILVRIPMGENKSQDF